MNSMFSYVPPEKLAGVVFLASFLIGFIPSLAVVDFWFGPIEDKMSFLLLGYAFLGMLTCGVIGWGFATVYVALSYKPELNLVPDPDFDKIYKIKLEPEPELEAQE